MTAQKLLLKKAMNRGVEIVSVPQFKYRSLVWVIEDDPYVAKYICKRLVVEGFEVDEFRDGAEAFEHLGRGRLPDLILTDLQMPNMDGLQFLTQIQQAEKFSSIPVLVLSATATVVERVKCLDSGASDYLCKPIDGAELAARVRVHLRNTEELRQLRKEARFDPLTACLNRRGSIETIQREIERASRSESPLSVMLIDADRFKEINDTYGHAVGDEVLFQIADTLKECLRTSDVVGRLGGDEFVIALPDVGQPLAEQIKERIRDAVANIRVTDEEVRVNISIGLVVDDSSEYSLDKLFAMADSAMYADKKRRRESAGQGLTLVAAVGR